MVEYATYDSTGFEPADALQMPQQTPPVDRTEATPAAALGDNPAVQANGFLDFLRLPGGFSGVLVDPLPFGKQ